jgi:3-methyl-2-oxobutanoate hydroxymethyltransferase
LVSYQGNSSEALRSAIRIMKEAGAHAVKLEGGSEVIESVKRILSAGIPVMGHLGLTPQSIYKFGTYTVRAKEEAEAKKLREDALLLEEAGCFGLVLEKIPAKLAEETTKSLNIPVIGIGAGSGVDGQVLVFHDLVGITKEFSPRFLRRYLDLLRRNQKGRFSLHRRRQVGRFPEREGVLLIFLASNVLYICVLFLIFTVKDKYTCNHFIFFCI